MPREVMQKQETYLTIILKFTNLEIYKTIFEYTNSRFPIPNKPIPIQYSELSK